MERAPDGTPLYAPRGELIIEAGGERVLCHLCGRAYRDLATSHVYRAHGVDPDVYRLLAGLSPRRPLGFGDVSTYYRSRQLDQRLRLDELAGELGCADIAVRGDLIRLGLGPDRTRSHGACWRRQD